MTLPITPVQSAAAAAFFLFLVPISHPLSCG